MENFTSNDDCNIDRIDLCSKYHSCIELLKMKNKELNNDIRILKRLVYMLNVELELRDSNYRKNQSQLSQDFKTKEDLSADIRMIEPLLKAFEQTKEEKDELLLNYKQSFDEFSNRCKEIVAENDALRRQTEEAKMKAESTASEWKKLHEKFLLVEEHNRLLTRQIKLFQSKIYTIETVYQDSLKQLEDERKELYKRLETANTELCVLKGKHDALSDIKLQSVWQKEHQDLNLYDAVIAEMKNFSAELKLYQEKEMLALKNRIKFLENKNFELDVRLTTVTSERDHLRGYISAADLEDRELKYKFENLEKILLDAKKDEGNAKSEVMKCMDLIHDVVSTGNNSQLQLQAPVNEKNDTEKIEN